MGMNMIDAPARAAGRARRVRARRWRIPGWALGVLLTAPGLLVIGVLIVGPLAYGAYLSLQNYSLTTGLPMEWAGVDNYTTVLTDPQFYAALRNTTIYTVAATVTELILGFGLALLLYRLSRAQQVFRTVFSLPLMMAPLVMGLLWRFLYNPELGAINQVLRLLGWSHGGVPWLTDPTWALISVIIVDIWATTPFVIIVLLSGLVVLPQEVMEAAAIDGCGAVQRFLRITLPLMRPFILIALLVRAMDAFRVYDTVYVITQGGPANRTDVLSYYAYRTMFSNGDVGAGTASGIIILAIILAFGLVLIRLLRREALS